MELGYFETLVGVAELATALAGFSGVVVVFRSSTLAVGTREIDYDWAF